MQYSKFWWLEEAAHSTLACWSAKSLRLPSQELIAEARCRTKHHAIFCGKVCGAVCTREMRPRARAPHLDDECIPSETNKPTCRWRDLHPVVAVNERHTHRNFILDCFPELVRNTAADTYCRTRPEGARQLRRDLSSQPSAVSSQSSAPRQGFCRQRPGTPR